MLYNILKKISVEEVVLVILSHIFFGVIAFIVSGGYLESTYLENISRIMPNRIYFIDSVNAKIYYVIFSFFIMPTPITFIIAYYAFKIKKKPLSIKNGIMILLVASVIVLPVILFISHKNFIEISHTHSKDVPEKINNIE